MIFALDTTEERNREEQLHQSQKMQAVGQLAGGVAHDFNNVLTAIIGYSDLLLANHRPTDPSFQDIMQIKQNANRAAGLVRQLLAFSRRQTLRPQVLQLGDVLSELQMLTRRLVGEKIEVDLKQGRDLWLVKADLNQFEQVIMNLIVNARDAMPDGGKIFIRTKNVAAPECAAYGEKLLPMAEYVVVEVEDTGTGIPKDILDKIFDPFFTTKEVGKGTGLGLSMVYGIVKQTGGFVFSDSAGRARHDLPHLPDPAHPRGRSRRSRRRRSRRRRPAADHTGHGVVLLVEDEEAVRSFGARALASRGYTVLEAETGLDALRVVEETQAPYRPGGLRRGHAGNGRADHVRRIAQARHQMPGDLRLRLCRGRVLEKPARGRGFRLHAQALHAQAADRDGESQHAVRRNHTLTATVGP